MFQRGFSVAILLGAFLLINGCGGGGGGSGSSSGGGGGGGAAGNPSTTFAGLWSGTFTYTGSAPAEAVAITIENGRFEILLLDSGVQLSGTAIINGTDVTADGFAYAPIGGFLPGAVKVSAFSFMGMLDAGGSLTGDWQITAGNDSGSFALEYDPEHEKNASLALVADMWTRFDDFQNPLIVFDIDANGAIFGQGAVCTSAGEITVTDPKFNTYEWHTVVTGAACPAQEEFFGLSALSDDEATLFVLGSGPQHPLMLLLER